MALDPDCMVYPKRRYGMDHDRYAWSMLSTRKPVAWPGGKKLALWVNVSLQHFPMNPAGKPVKLPGSMTMPYPDLRHFTLRDYGNRVGIYRFLDAFKRYGIKPTFAINAQLAERYPGLLRDVLDHGGEVLGHSWNMDTPHAGGLDEATEADTIARSLDRLRALTGQPVRGWLSPGRLESPNTPELLKSNGIDYFCDWVNDDMPYRFHTRHGDLWAMPLPTEIEDRFVIMDNQHAEASWAQQVIDAGQMLLAEAREQGGRILSLSIHPWVLGQPHRIKHLETALAALSAEPEVWCAGAGEILDAFVSQGMTAAAKIDILVSEVGPRDGLQSIAAVMPTAAKKAWISAEAAAGVREIEVGSFVPASLLPQLADTAELVAHALTIDGLSVAVLVPNFKGAQRAIECGAHKITLPLSCSESHSLKNLRRTHAQVIEEARAIGELLRSLPAARRPCFEGALSTAFGCTIEGLVPERKVVELAEALMAAGCDEVGLSDTTGYANPTQVRSLTRAVWAAVGRDRLTGLHLHNTRGQGLANVVAALDIGLTTLDASLGGIGGCPFAPGASGNIVTEDLVFLLEAMGYRTGIDIDRLLAVRRLVQAALPGETLYGFVPDAGLPKGFVPAAAQAPALVAE